MEVLAKRLVFVVVVALSSGHMLEIKYIITLKYCV